MVGGNADMGCAALDHGQHRTQDTPYCADFLAVHIRRSRHGKKVAEQFIRSVNQVHIHAAPVRKSFYRQHAKTVRMGIP